MKGTPEQPADQSEAEPKTNEVFHQPWIESERGWGVRPDGYSLHLSEADRDLYIEAYWHSMPPGAAPTEYSKPGGDTEKRFAHVNVYEALQEARSKGEYGLRFYFREKELLMEQDDHELEKK